jgi:hypothetical protein
MDDACYYIYYIVGHLKIESSYTNLSRTCMSIFVCVEETKIQRNKEGKKEEAGHMYAPY